MNHISVNIKKIMCIELVMRLVLTNLEGAKELLDLQFCNKLNIHKRSSSKLDERLASINHALCIIMSILYSIFHVTNSSSLNCLDIY